jgi:hypothetical protein
VIDELVAMAIENRLEDMLVDDCMDIGDLMTGQRSLFDGHEIEIEDLFNINNEDDFTALLGSLYGIKPDKKSLRRN